MWSDDRSWPVRLADLDKCYDSSNYYEFNSLSARIKLHVL